MIVRQPTIADLAVLVEMRREFTFEDNGGGEFDPEYEARCEAFLIDAIHGDRWRIWLAEDEGEVVSHVYVGLVDRVPRPVVQRRRWAYMTNVYTRPAYRGRGVGGRIVEEIRQWALEADVELMIVWPSDESRPFYAREGFVEASEAMVWTHRS